MSELLDPTLLTRLETDVASLIQTCKTLVEENKALSESYARLHQAHQQLQERHHNAIDHAKTLLDALTSPKETVSYEHNQ